MKSSIKISIIIPTYNSAATLEKCLESIIEQTFTNYEVLIIDGASKDSTLAVAQRLEETRIKIFSEPDKGIYDAMNKGIRLAQGEWIYFLGSDDTFYDSHVLNSVKKGLLASTDFVHYGNVMINGNCGWASDGMVYDGEFDLKKLLKKNICHQAIFYNLSFLKNNDLSYNINYPVLSDWDFNLRCWSICTFKYENIIIANFNAGGATSNTIVDPFNNDFVSNFLNYFKISAFDKSTELLPIERIYSLYSLRKQENPFLYYLQKIKYYFR